MLYMHNEIENVITPDDRKKKKKESIGTLLLAETEKM